jgi:hypothetical protein
MTHDFTEIGGAQSHHFMGKNGFLWWVGIVEDRQDPLGLGRAKVRIFGHHHERQSVIPTEDLPWALALTPLSNSMAPKSPPNGTWVLGFFLDGQIAQQPVMLGCLPGYRYKVARSETSNNSPLPT